MPAASFSIIGRPVTSRSISGTIASTWSPKAVRTPTRFCPAWRCGGEGIRDVLAQQLVRDNPVHHVPGERHVELRKQLGPYLRVVDDPGLRDHHEEESRLRLVREDPPRC